MFTILLASRVKGVLWVWYHMLGVVSDGIADTGTLCMTYHRNSLMHLLTRMDLLPPIMVHP